MDIINNIKLLKSLTKLKYFKFKYLSIFLGHRKKWLAQGGKITHYYPIFNDFKDNAGSAKGHYFHQDLLIAKFIYEKSPEKHIDIGSRIDGFVAHVASFRKIEVYDIRPLPKSIHNNIAFKQINFMDSVIKNETDSLSCLHAIEHFGLGRYTDPIDINGHIKGIKNLIQLLKDSGYLYISFPIGKTDEIHFNAHRVFHPLSIFQIPEVNNFLCLKRFDYVDDDGTLHLDIDIYKFSNIPKYGCGIYTFQKDKS